MTVSLCKTSLFCDWRVFSRDKNVLFNIEITLSFEYPIEMFVCICRDDPGARARSSPIRADASLTKVDGNNGADTAEAGISRAEPVPTNGKDLAMGSTDNGQPQRVRKGRGFTQQYAFARRYRTPSPERSPVRSRYNDGRNDRWNHFNRYCS